MKMTRRQRLTVDFFNRYTVRAEDIGRKRFQKGVSIDTMVNDLRPLEDPIDKRLYYELTGVNHESNIDGSSSFSEHSEGHQEETPVASKP